MQVGERSSLFSLKMTNKQKNNEQGEFYRNMCTEMKIISLVYIIIFFKGLVMTRGSTINKKSLTDEAEGKTNRVI